jgi:hypothetical protein
MPDFMLLNQYPSLFGLPLYQPDFWMLLIRFAFNFAVLLVIVRWLYYRKPGDRDFAFTYLIFNPLIFFITYLMSGVKLEIGFAFGLFAVFSVLRYRTLTIPVKEMTYLFAVITIAVINALSTGNISYAELLFTNGSILALLAYLEYAWYKNALKSAIIQYEVIDNIHPDRHPILLEDLRQRTGLPIERFEILRTDFLRDTARIRIFYRDAAN